MQSLGLIFGILYFPNTINAHSNRLSTIASLCVSVLGSLLIFKEVKGRRGEERVFVLGREERVFVQTKEERVLFLIGVGEQEVKLVLGRVLQESEEFLVREGRWAIEERLIRGTKTGRRIRVGLAREWTRLEGIREVTGRRRGGTAAGRAGGRRTPRGSWQAGVEVMVTELSRKEVVDLDAIPGIGLELLLEGSDLSPASARVQDKNLDGALNGKRGPTRADREREGDHVATQSVSASRPFLFGPGWRLDEVAHHETREITAVQVHSQRERAGSLKAEEVVLGQRCHNGDGFGVVVGQLEGDVLVAGEGRLTVRHVQGGIGPEGRVSLLSVEQGEQNGRGRGHLRGEENGGEL